MRTVGCSCAKESNSVLHLFGIDHTQLTYKFQGRDFRLTDMSG